MKLDLTPRQAAWLRDALRRVDEGQNLDDEEQAALDTYYNAEYYEWLQDREADGRPLTEEQERYLEAFVGYEGTPDGARVYHEPAARRGASPRRRRGGCLGNLVGLAILALFVRFAWGVVRSAIDNPPPALVATRPAAPKSAKSVAKVATAKAAKARAAEQPAVPARSAWRAETYTGASGARLPMLVGDGSLFGGYLVVRDPRGACLVEIQAPRGDTMGGRTDWSAPVSVLGGGAIRTEQWLLRNESVASMKIVDDRGDFHPDRGRELLDLLLAQSEDKEIAVPYPRAGKSNALVVVPLRGLRAALESLPAPARRPVADL